MVGQHSPGQGHGGEETEALPVQAGHCLSPTRQGRCWGGEPRTGQKLGTQLYCPLVLSVAGWLQGREGRLTLGQRSSRERGSQRGKMALLPWPPTPFRLQAQGGVGPGWSGPASSLPSFPGGRQNYSPGAALYFLKADQRWEPARSSSKISAMWSLGAQWGPGAGGRGKVPGPACGLRGETRVPEWSWWVGTSQEGSVT